MTLNDRASAKRFGFAALVILMITILAYLPAMSAGYIWDDGLFLTNNPFVHSADGWWKCWTDLASLDYLPVVADSFWLEFRLWGDAPAGYHFTNVVLYGLNAVLLWRLLGRIGPVKPRRDGFIYDWAWFAGLLFAVHPVAVESAAWIAERKNTLSGFFFLLAAICYLDFDTRRRWSPYAASICLFTLGALSKSSVVVLPAILVLFVLWRHGARAWRKTLFLIPHFVIALGLGLLAAYIQRHNVPGFAYKMEHLPGVAQRIAGAGFAFWFYLSKDLFPVRLIPIYPPWRFFGNALDFVPAVLAVGMFPLAWRFRRAPAGGVLLAFAWYTLAVLPVLGLVKMVYMIYAPVADHLQYLGLMPVMAAVAFVVHVAAERFSSKQTMIVRCAQAAMVLTLSVLTWQQCALYHDQTTYWKASIRYNQSSWPPYSYFGRYLRGSSDPADRALAMTYLRKGAAIAPHEPITRYELGEGLEMMGDTPGALAEYRAAADLQPTYEPVFWFKQAVVYEHEHKLSEAINAYRRAVGLYPALYSGRVNLAMCLMQTGQLHEALKTMRALVDEQPGNATWHLQLAAILRASDKAPESDEEIRRASELDPDLVRRMFQPAAR